MQEKFYKKIAYAFLTLSALGFIDATFLTVEHLRNSAPPCSIITGCEEVTTSKYAEIFGIPIALIGSLYYASLFLFSFGYLQNKKTLTLRFIQAATTCGILVSAVLVYLQLFVIKALCIYCIFSAGMSAALFITSVFAWVQSKK